MPYVGQPLKRFEDRRLMTGGGSYLDDMTMPDMVHAIFVRSTHANANIRSIDVAAARDMPGVVAVITGEEIAAAVDDIPHREVAEMEGVKIPGHPALARDKVCYVGQPVALIIAEDHYTAADALDLIQIDYEPLPVAEDPLQASRSDTFPIHAELGGNVVMRAHESRGDLDKTFAQADRIVWGRYSSPRLSAAPMETRAVLAQFLPGTDALTLWTSTQTPHRVKTYLGRLLKNAPANIRVIVPDVGGGFGQKVELWPEELALGQAAMVIQRPIKWVEERWENLLAYHARGFSGEVEAAVKNDGTILGMRMRFVADMGAYFLIMSPGPPINAVHRAAGPYAIPDMDVECVAMLTNKPPTGPYRGAGGPEGAYFMERSVDQIAKELNIDPAEVRRRNFIKPEDFPYATATGLVYDSGDFQPALDKALDLADYAGYRKAQSDNGTDGPLIGIGIATVVKASGGTNNEMRSSNAIVKVEPTGQVKVYTEVSPHGQGTETTFSQIVADQMGVEMEDVQILHGDTDMLESGQGTFASRGLSVGGSAMYVGLQAAREKMALIAASVLECPAENIEFEDGKLFNREDRERVMSFYEVASAAHQPEKLPGGMEVGLEFPADFSLPANPFGFAVHIAVVEIDRDNGYMKVIHYAAVHDCGHVINPRLLEGQIHGAIAQGLGQARTEVTAYDVEGQPLNASFMDYGMPIAQTMPEIRLGLTETPSPTNPMGVKGIGELPTVAAPVAVANAVVDALSRSGAPPIDTPVTSEKIWRALHG
ncbi:MAG: carbon monoxide dehydrogenase [Planctomyces sp.]|nr:carbon monoxide dehydrogenase [Planctomyces sp.]